MNIKKSQLVQIIESVVRECITERNAQLKAKLNEAGLTSEKADGQIRPLDDIIKAVIKSGVKGKSNIIKAAKELYKKQMNKRGADDDAVEAAVSDAGVTSEESNNPKVADDFELNGWSLVNNPEPQYKIAPSQVKDVPEKNVDEAAYKVVSPNQVDCSAEDKARTIQTEPKVNETAYKTQGPSAKTFKDSPQFPEAVNDPENA